jgi:hypothetical protein
MEVSSYPTTFSAEHINLLDISNMSNRGHDSVYALQTKGLEMVSGIMETDIDQILAISATTDVKEFCPNDEKRFSDPEKWLAKGRGAFLLRAIANSQIVGYSWVGLLEEEVPELPNHPVTSAFRSQVRGTGKDLVIATIEAARAIHGSSMIGLETWASNPAVRTYVHPRVGINIVDNRSQESDKETGEMIPIMRPTIRHAKAPDAVVIKGKPHIRDTRLFGTFPEPTTTR